MVKVRAGDVEAAIRRPDPRITVFLVYGPDTGLVSERARRLATGAVDDADDPFQLVRLDGDAVAGDPGRLADEAGTMALFGGKRAVWVGATTRNLAAAVTAVLAAPAGSSLVVIEAGDLGASAPLRTLCEKAPNAAALPCYADGARDLATLIDTMAQDAGLKVDPAARTRLVGLLGGDRAASRMEIEKLLLHARGREALTEADIDAVGSDVSSLAYDAATDAAFAGRLDALDQAWMRMVAEGADVGVLLAAVLRHALLLLRLSERVRGGERPAEVADGQRVHFSRKDALVRQISLWARVDDLPERIAHLSRTIAEARRQPRLGRDIARTALWQVALRARAAAAR